jgi:hypothetical protein
MEKEKKKGLKTSVTERTVFNDEEQRRCANMNLFCCFFYNIIHVVFFKKTWCYNHTFVCCYFYTNKNCMFNDGDI